MLEFWTAPPAETGEILKEFDADEKLNDLDPEFGERLQQRLVISHIN